jgi:hypothetical protein
MPFLFRTLLVAFLMMLSAYSHADDAWYQAFKKGFLDGCIGRGLERKQNPEYVKSFCNCSIDVITTNLNESEIKELDSASKGKPSTAADAAMNKIQDKMFQCKTKDGLKP